MAVRTLHPLPIKPPRGVVLPEKPVIYPENTGYISGQAAAIRFFDPELKTDYRAIMEILKAKGSRQWVDDVQNLSYSDYKEWAGNHTEESFLFSVHDAREQTLEAVREVRGFINFYLERAEKFRVKRMEQLGYLKPVKGKRHCLEVSFALRPFKDGTQIGSGLMSSALRQSCLQVRSLLKNPPQQAVKIFAFTDSKNVASARTLESAGFIKRGLMKYDSTSGERILYVLSWRKLHQKVRNKLWELYEDKTEVQSFDECLVVVTPHMQLTDSHCGPAVIQTLMAFYGIEVTQDQVVEAAEVKSRLIKYGMTPEHLAKAVRRLAPNLVMRFKQGATIKDIKKIIHTYKIPVGLDWQGLFYNTPEEEKLFSKLDDHGHYTLAVDIDINKDKIVMADPYSEYYSKPKTRRLSWFKTRWWDTEIIRDKITGKKGTVKISKLIFVVVPKKMEMSLTSNDRLL